MKINDAVINIGSNSVKLLAPSKSALGHREAITCQLSQGQTGGILNGDAVLRTVDAVKTLYESAVSRKPKHIYIYATEAVRSAKNRNSLIDRVKQITSLDTDIIDGKTEAMCAYLGAKLFFPDLDALLDIGGASTEIVTVGEYAKISRMSLPIGAVRLTDVGGNDYFELLALAREAVARVPLKNSAVCVGTSGSFSSLAVIAHKMDGFDSEKVHGKILDRAALDGLTSYLIPLSPEEIAAKHPAVDLRRANVLKAGLAILAALKERVTCDAVTVSSADGLHGYLIYKGTNE